MNFKVMTQEVPNPNARKYIINMDVRYEGKATFNSASECDHVPLAYSMFMMDSVGQVHFFENVITVTTDGGIDWVLMDRHIKSCIDEHLANHDPGFPTGLSKNKDHYSVEMVMIDSILDRTIRPYLQRDGGDIDLVSYKDNHLEIFYVGACGSCPSSRTGTLNAIISTLHDEYNPDLTISVIE